MTLRDSITYVVIACGTVLLVKVLGARFSQLIVLSLLLAILGLSVAALYLLKRRKLAALLEFSRELQGLREDEVHQILADFSNADQQIIYEFLGELEHLSSNRNKGVEDESKGESVSRNGNEHEHEKGGKEEKRAGPFD